MMSQEKTIDREQMAENMVDLGEKLESGGLSTVEMIENVFDMFKEEQIENKNLSNELKKRDELIKYLQKQVAKYKKLYRIERELKLEAMDNYDVILKEFNKNTDLFEKIRKENLEYLKKEKLDLKLELEQAQIRANNNNNIEGNEGKEQELGDIDMSGNDDNHNDNDK